MWGDARRGRSVLAALLALCALARVGVAAGAPAPLLHVAIAACVLGLALAALAGWLRPGPALLLLLALYWLPHLYTQAGGDGLQSFVAARSVLFDRDLVLENDYAGLGATPVLAADGRAVSAMPIGTALLWLPALCAAHVGVVAASLLGAPVSADGFSPAYPAAAMVWTFALGIAALVLLEAWLCPRFGPAIAFLATAGTWLATALHYYLVVTPSMTHAPSALLAVLLFLAWMWARALPSGQAARRPWVAVGLLAGLAVLVRPQDAVLLLLPIGDLLLRHRRRWREAGQVLAPAVGLALLQVGVWAWFHGAGFVAAVAEGSFVGRSSPQPLHVLFSARHGFVSWTPVAGVALLGLAAALWRDTRVAGLGLLTVAASVALNGAMQDWWGSDSFGQRRLLGLTPLVALGLAHALEFARRRPLLVPAGLLALLAAWNVAFTGIFNARLLAPRGEAVSLDRLLPAQADVAVRQLLAAESWLPSRVFFYLYDNLRGVYLDEGPRSLAGTLDLGAETDAVPVLGGGWGEAQRDDDRTWRRARGPRSTLRLPVRTPGTFQARLLARALSPDVRLRVRLGERDLFEGPVSDDWSPILLTLPAESVHAGFNDLELEWTQAGAPLRGAAADVDRVEFERPRLGRKGG